MNIFTESPNIIICKPGAMPFESWLQDVSGELVKVLMDRLDLGNVRAMFDEGLTPQAAASRLFDMHQKESCLSFGAYIEAVRGLYGPLDAGDIDDLHDLLVGGVTAPDAVEILRENPTTGRG